MFKFSNIFVRATYSSYYCTLFRQQQKKTDPNALSHVHTFFSHTFPCTHSLSLSLSLYTHTHTRSSNGCFHSSVIVNLVGLKFCALHRLELNKHLTFTPQPSSSLFYCNKPWAVKRRCLRILSLFFILLYSALWSFKSK
jgi:hypothetical protein